METFLCVFCSKDAVVNLLSDYSLGKPIAVKIEFTNLGKSMNCGKASKITY